MRHDNDMCEAVTMHKYYLENPSDQKHTLARIKY